MSRNSQLRIRTPIPTSLSRPFMVRAFDMEPDSDFDLHQHAWGQLTYALDGILIVWTPQGSWTVPPARAVWIPAHVDHAINNPNSSAAFRSVYVDQPHAGRMGDTCRVLRVTDLLRQLIVRAADIAPNYDEDSPDGRLMRVLFDQILDLREDEPLHLPMPMDPRLKRIAGQLLNDPADRRPLAELAKNAGSSERTIARLFVSETGLSFGDWRRRLCLIQAVERLVGGEPVTSVALEMGYESPSAFIAMFRRTLGSSPTAYLNRS